MDAYEQGFQDKLAQVGMLWPKKESPAGEVVGGTAGGLGGLAGARAAMRRSPEFQQQIVRILKGRKNIMGRLAAAYGKRLIPPALLLGAIGSILGGQVQDRL
jgi:hypothetical protein